MTEKLTKIWHSSKAANGKFALCHAGSLADNTKTAVKFISCNSWQDLDNRPTSLPPTEAGQW